jgi:pimeloyl-ACP methyl ester carboxylesterase
MRRLSPALALLSAVSCLGFASPSADRLASIAVRGHVLTAHVEGSRGAVPVVLLSGDGGWIHLAPHVAAVLASHGYYVVGIDSRAYLETFTGTGAGLSREQVPDDLATIADWAAQGGSSKPILAGVSEGAALCVLGATRVDVQRRVSGVVSFGLPPVAELAWHWKDAWIYVSHGVPNEPLFDVAAILGNVSPVPFAALYATHDEFVPAAEAERLMTHAREPRQTWTIPASNHRFSDNEAELDRRTLEATEWIRRVRP